MPPLPHRIEMQRHPGSSQQDIENEPDWADNREHRIGYTNRQDRKPGFTHEGDERDNEDAFEAKASGKLQNLRSRIRKGELVDFRDIVANQEAHSQGWRYRLDWSEDWIKNVEDWPANRQKRKSEEQAQQQQNTQENSETEETPQQEHEWKRATQPQDDTKHHDAYPSDAKEDKENIHPDEDSTSKIESEYQKLRNKYSPQEIALLRNLQHEKVYISQLEQNDGKRASPVKINRRQLSIDEADQFSPDNWIPRSDKLVRLTGKHPLNAEPQLTPLFDAGLITPNEFHYVRNHGAVPRLLWETHKLEVNVGKGRSSVFTMDNIRINFDPINVAVSLACDGNRRKELNMIKRSKGFNWGSGAVSCAYWRGPLMRDVLLAAGLEPSTLRGDKRFWVNFEGADEPSEGKYATCIPIQSALDPTNDVILAYEMNDSPLLPDHGYPLRVIIPGYVGGRSVKWLQKLWISDEENGSHYHIWDNRVLPSFVTEKDGEFAETLFRHPDTACNEQNLNSVIVKPAQGERIEVRRAWKGETYRIEGYAHDGGGHEVQRVEVSLDGGRTWLYCIRKFPQAPIRHGSKFWTWLHWHIDIDIAYLLRCESIAVRCFNVFKNTQPQHPSWNIMGMMNNCWYIVRPEIVEDRPDGATEILWRHPTEPGTGDEGWMKLFTEMQIANAKQSAGTPGKQFTRAEVEKHGGKATILGHAGKLDQETSSEFDSIHDGYAWSKLNECVLGTLTTKASNYLTTTARSRSTSTTQPAHIALQPHRWVPVTLQSRHSIPPGTRTYTLSLQPGKTALGLQTCQHLQLGFHLLDRMHIRSYTPTRPILSTDENGTFDLVVKTYFPTDDQPGGAMSNILDCIAIGEQVEMRGPTGEITYGGNGDFDVEGKKKHWDRVSLILGGSGITPGYQLLARICKTEGDETEVRVIDANKTEGDILLKDEMEAFVQGSEGRVQVTHVLSHPGEGWSGKRGHVGKEVVRENLFQPGKGSVVFLCGPPTMIQKAALPALTEWGYEEEENCFGF
ncbi:MAG: hypothetical protein Q9181_001346 [Wetmoreana brouardii]